MKNKKYIFILFILVVLIQLFVPLNITFEHKNILKNGKEYKFEVAPIDPTDPFRGKYITLRYKNNTFMVKNYVSWKRNDDVYVLFSTDNKGFAKIKSISKKKPGNNKFYLKSTIIYLNYINKEIIINYPFNRYYIGEYKAKKTEEIYRKYLNDSTKTIYALVKIKNGKAVIKDIRVNKKSIKQLFK